MLISGLGLNIHSLDNYNLQELYQKKSMRPLTMHFTRLTVLVLARITNIFADIGVVPDVANANGTD